MKKKLTGTILLSTLLMSMAYAADYTEKQGDFTLDPIVITAQRYETRDLDTPATTSIYTQKDLENTGAATLEEALRFATGITFKAETSGSGGGEFLVRGKRRGTLVMVDGVPLNFRTGYYDLDVIPVENVKQVEVIRGGGAVLYGSDTTGGVINIITKKKLNNSVSVSVGNYGRQRHQVQAQADKVSFGFVYDKKGEKDRVSEPSLTKKGKEYDSKYFDFKGGEKYIFNVRAALTDDLSFTVDYSDHLYKRQYNYANKEAAAIYDKRRTHRKELKQVLSFERDGWKGNLFFHKADNRTRYMYYEYPTFTSAEVKRILDREYTSDALDRKWGGEVQKQWQVGSDVVLAGLSMQREAYGMDLNNRPSWDENTGLLKTYGKEKHTAYQRNIYSVFAQWEHNPDDYNTVIFSARETWTGNSPGGKEFKQFTPQIQYLHKVNDNVSIYGSYSKSFTLPTLPDMFGKGSTEPNPDIRPERGDFYEAGVKVIDDNRIWKLAFFKSDVKDFIRLKTIKGTNREAAMNEDTRNRGVELSVEVKNKAGLSGNFGISLSNPQFFDTSKAKTEWQRSYGKVQLTGGLNYRKDKWLISFQGTYLGNRVLESLQIPVRPSFTTSLYARYDVNPYSFVFLSVDNVFNREDIVSHVSSRYNAMPLNFRVGYNYKF